MDGVVEGGVSTFDESMLTGEPTASRRVRGGGDGGTVNGLRDVTVTAARVNQDTLVFQVAEMVERGAARAFRFSGPWTASRGG